MLILPPPTAAELAGPPFTLDENTASFTLTLSDSSRVYQLQRSISLDENSWKNVGPAVPGTGSPIVLQDPARPQSRCFYRVLIGP